MRIAIISRRKNAYSETFIRAQATQLQGDKFFLWEMGLQNDDDGWLLPIESRNNYAKQKESLKTYFLHNRIELVLAQYGVTAVHVLEAAIDLKIPLIVHFHGFDAYASWVLTQYGQRYLAVFSYSSKIIAVSKDMVEQLVKLGAPPEKIVYAPYGPDNIFFDNNPSFEQINFVSVGRFVNKKAPYLTIAAFKEVIPHYPEVKLVMVGGDEPLKEICLNLVTAWRLDKHVKFLGVLNPLEVKTILNESYCFLQHSITALDGDGEGTPIAILEASAAALPIIATAHHGIKDVVIHGTTGLLVNELDIESMTRAMMTLIKNRNEAKRLGENGRKHIKNHFSMAQYINAINQAMSETTPTG